MFERFTEAAREVVVGAQREARSLGHDWIGTEHLLLAALAGPDSELAQSLGRLGLTAAAMRAEVVREVGSVGDDAAALRDLGIDLEEVRRRVEQRFGPGALDPPASQRRRRLGSRLLRRRRGRGCGGRGGHIPFTPKSKKALELALRESMQLRSGEIRAGHLVLGTLASDGLATEVVTRLGVSAEDVRRAVLEQLGRAA